MERKLSRRTIHMQPVASAKAPPGPKRLSTEGGKLLLLRVPLGQHYVYLREGQQPQASVNRQQEPKETPAVEKTPGMLEIIRVRSASSGTPSPPRAESRAFTPRGKAAIAA